MVDQNMCPVCGYRMEEPPEQYNICASCGTEFGVHDVNASIEELRVAWLRTGPNWFSSVDPEPQDWNPFLQITGSCWRKDPFRQPRYYPMRETTPIPSMRVLNRLRL